MDSIVKTVWMSLLLNGTQQTNAIIESDWRTKQKSIITVTAKVQIHNSCHCLNIACIYHLSFKGSFRTRRSPEDKYMMDRGAKSFPYEKRLDRFRILKLEKKRR